MTHTGIACDYVVVEHVDHSRRRVHEVLVPVVWRPSDADREVHAVRHLPHPPDVEVDIDLVTSSARADGQGVHRVDSCPPALLDASFVNV